MRKEANDRFLAQMLGRRKNQIFWQDSCVKANSYYFDPIHGDVPLRPSPTLEVSLRSARFDLDDYRFEVKKFALDQQKLAQPHAKAANAAADEYNNAVKAYNAEVEKLKANAKN